MSSRSPRNVIVDEGREHHSLGIARALPNGVTYQSVATLRLRSGVSLRVFIERKGEGS